MAARQQLRITPLPPDSEHKPLRLRRLVFISHFGPGSLLTTAQCFYFSTPDCGMFVDFCGKFTSSHNPVENAVEIREQILILEGNWLLLDEEPWNRLRCDYSIFLRAGDERQLSEKIRELWENEELLEKYTENCKNVLFDTSEEYCEKLIEVYREAGA